MSEAAEKETEVVAGVIEGVTQKRPDTWQVAVKPEGSQYAKNLWTKDAELVSALGKKLSQVGVFVCFASYWEKDGRQIRSLWINEAQDSAGDMAVGSETALRTAQARSTPGTAARDGAAQTKSSDGVDWDAKERRDYRSRAWAQTISALTHTIKVDEPPADIYRRLYALQRMIYRDIVRDLDPEAFQDDDIPF